MKRRGLGAQRRADHSVGEAAAVELAVARELLLARERRVRERTPSTLSVRRRSRSGRVTFPSSIRKVPSRVTAVISVSLGRTDVRVPEPRHVDAALDLGAQLSFVACAAAREHQVGRVRPARRFRPGSARGRCWPCRHRAALRTSWATAWATPSWISGSGAFWLPSASNERGSVRALVGESDRLIAGALIRSPSRPTSAPRPSACARPLKAVSAEQVEEPAHRLRLEYHRV